MDADELRVAAQVLASHWRHEKPDNPTAQMACYQLERALQDYLPKGSIGRLRRVSSTQITRLSAALAQLMSKPGIEALVVSIVHAQEENNPSKPSEQISRDIPRRPTIMQQTDRISQTMHVTIVQPLQPQPIITPSEPRLTLQLSARENNAIEVRVLQSLSAAEGSAMSTLPYTADELVPVLKALATDSFDSTQFTNEQSALLQHRSLLRSEGIDRRIHQLVGQAFHNALFAGVVGEVFRAVLDQNTSSSAIHLQLYFNEDHVDLARYPWELIHDGRRPLIKNRVVYLTRYITYREPPPKLRLSPPFDLLYVAPRPQTSRRQVLPPDQDLQPIRAAFTDLERAGHANIRILTPPTRQALVRELQRRPAQIVHFDSHGSFARVCPGCGTRNHPHILRCANDKCKDSLVDVAPEGLLLLEDDRRQEDWVNSEDVASMLSHRGVQLAVLLTCMSGTVRGATLFSGMGPMLIQNGIPMVIATQADISSDGARAFSEGFYGALARGEQPAAAAATGRDLLQSRREWYVPVVYLRERR